MEKIALLIFLRKDRILTKMPHPGNELQSDLETNTEIKIKTETNTNTNPNLNHATMGLSVRRWKNSLNNDDDLLKTF